MTSYLENLKWILSKQEVSNPTSKLPGGFEIVDGHNGDNEIEGDYDFGPIANTDSRSQSQTQPNIQDVISQYNTIQLEMKQKEQLVRERLDSDTIDKIKSNYTDYINDDIKIIKDFAIIMETFSHIQKKLSEFEHGIKEFELDMKNKTSTQDSNNQEFENKIQQIDIKLNDTLKFIEEIKLNNDIVMEKIIKLENTINLNDIKGQEILTRLEKINHTNNKDKNENIIGQCRQNGYFRIPLYNNLSDILIYVLTSSCVIGTYFGIKYILRKN